MTTESGPDAVYSDRGSRVIRGQPDPGLSAIGARRHLINLAYRLLGSLTEAEDAVQETYARWYALSWPQQQAIASPGAWLTTVASRICLDVLGSARARRERYVGPWIPEPLPDPAEWAGRPGGASVDPANRVTLDESVAMAFLVVLESMTPAERVAFILHAAGRGDPEFQASRAATVADLHDRGVDMALGQGDEARAVRQAPRVVANPQLYRVVAGYAIPPGADEPLPVGPGPAAR